MDLCCLMVHSSFSLQVNIPCRGGRASIKARPNLLFKTFCCLIKVRPLIFSAPETRSVCFDNLEEVGLGEM